MFNLALQLKKYGGSRGFKFSLNRILYFYILKEAAFPDSFNYMFNKHKLNCIKFLVTQTSAICFFLMPPSTLFRDHAVRSRSSFDSQISQYNHMAAFSWDAPAPPFCWSELPWSDMWQYMAGRIATNLGPGSRRLCHLLCSCMHNTVQPPH